jgi:putative aldouronate transport system substrate-binding protein
MLFGPWWSTAGIPESVKNNPAAEWTAVTAPVDAEGNLHIYARDPLNSIMVVRKGYEHPEAIIKVINAEMDIIRGHGEKGAAAREVRIKEAPSLSNNTMPINLQIDYVNAMERNINDITQALEKNDINALQYPNNRAMFQSFVMDRDNYKKDIGVWHNVLVRKFGMRAAMAKNTKIEPVVFHSTTETMSTKWTNLKKLETAMIIQIIMGEKPISEFDNFVSQWYKMGGTEITAEVEAERIK